MMLRRDFHQWGLAVLLGCAYGQAHALSLADISRTEASNGLQAALESAAAAAVGLLGQSGGFLDNPKVHIPLPGQLEKAAQMLRGLGQGKRIDELVTAMNRAAESAIPAGKDLLIGAVRSMTVEDAKKILTEGDTSVTRFFAEKTRVPLGEKFLPVVTQATQKLELAQRYNALAAKAAGFGLLRQEDAKLEPYVTGKTLDGLYLVIGEQEQKIRQNPAAAGSAIVQKVFGALR